MKIKNQSARRPFKQPRRDRSRGTSIGLWLLIGMLLGVILAASGYLLITGKWSILPAELKLESQVEGDIKEDDMEGSINQNITDPKQHNKKATKGTSKKTAAAEITQRFEFYQLLPGMEVPIPDGPTKDPNVKTPSHAHHLNSPSPSPTPESTTHALTPKSQEIPAVTETPESTTKPLTPKKLVVNTQTQKTRKVEQPQPKPSTQKKVAAAQYLIQTGAFREQKKAENLKARLSSNGFAARIQKIDAEDGIWFRVILGPFPNESTALNQKILLTKHKIQGILILQRR